MASAIKKVDKIRQIVQLKHVMKRLKLSRKPQLDSDSESDCNAGSPHQRIPSGSLAVYVGSQRRRFVIPTRFLNLPIFVSLLQKSEEEFGYQSHGGLVLPCEVRFFKGVLKVLEKDEQRFRKMELDEFLKMFSEVGFEPCHESSSSCHGFTPLLQKARV